MPEFAPEHLELTDALTARAQREAERARETLAARERVLTLCESLALAVRERHPAAVLALLRDHEPEVAELSRQESEVSAGLDAIRKVAEAQAAEQRDHFAALIEAGATTFKTPLDRTSRHPRYSFADGALLLEVDDGRLEARLRNYEGDLHRIPADVTAVLRLVDREYERVFGRHFDGAKLLAKIRRHYCAVLQRRAGLDGEPVPIRAITQRLGKNEKGFRTDEFAADLARLAREGPHTIDGRIVELQQTKDDQQGMLLPGLAGRGQVGFIIFREGARQ